MSGSYIPEFYYGMIPGTYGEMGLVPWPKHLQPYKAAAPEEAKQSKPEAPAPLVNAGGVFFVTLSSHDRAGIATTIERLINMLDVMDGDENLEATGDDEPSLGWPEGRGIAQIDKSVPPDDREDENEHGGDVQDEPHDAIDCGDDEPNLGRLEILHQGAGSYDGISDDATGLLAGNLDFRGDGYRQTREALRSRRVSQFPREYAERVTIMPDDEEFRTFVPIRRDRP